MEILILGGLLLFVLLITKGADARMEAKGEDTPAPEWARVLFVVFVAGLLFACVMAAPGF